MDLLDDDMGIGLLIFYYTLSGFLRTDIKFSMIFLLIGYYKNALYVIRSEDKDFHVAKKFYPNVEWSLGWCCVLVRSVAKNGCTALAQSTCSLLCHAECNGEWHSNGLLYE